MSFLWGTIDAVYSWYSNATQSEDLRFFRKGWGDMEKHQSLVDEIETSWSRDGLKTFFAQNPINLEWSPHHYDANRVVVSSDSSGSGSGSGSGTVGVGAPETQFDSNEVWADEAIWKSSLADSLPEGSREARVLFVRAAPTCDRFPKTRCIMLHMPCTGDEDYETRLQKLVLPLLEHGIASILVVPPLYGARRAAGQKAYYADNVAAYLIQSLAVTVESSQLMRSLACGFSVRNGETYKCPLAVTGFSWGGAIAACTAVMSQLPVACAPCIGMASPKALSTGIIQWQIDWSALMKEDKCSLVQATCKIERLFESFSLAKLLQSAPKKATLVSLVQVAATSDYYVSVEDGQQLHNTLANAVQPGGHSELEWVSGGHASAFLWATSIFVPACVRATDALLSARHLAPSWTM